MEAIYGNGGVSKSLRPLRLKEGGQRLRVRTYPGISLSSRGR